MDLWLRQPVRADLRGLQDSEAHAEAQRRVVPRSGQAKRCGIIKMNKVKLPPDVEFYEDTHLLVWRPRGLVNQEAVNTIITVLGELEFSLMEPFNRFTDTVNADAIDLNFEYIIQVSLY